MASPFHSAVEALRAPLDVAARDDFAGLARVSGLEASVCAAAERACALAIPRDARERLAALAARFAAPLPREALRGAIERALVELAPLWEPAWAEQALARSPSALPGVGPKRSLQLARRGASRIADLLIWLPARYDDRRALVPVGDLEVGRRASFVGRVLAADFAGRPARGRGRGGRVFRAVVGDESGTVGLKWFRGAESMARGVRKGVLLLVTGDVRRYRFSKELVHPEIELLAGEGAEASPDPERRCIVPDYAAPEGFPPRSFRELVGRAVAEYADLVEGFLPAELARERGLPEPALALCRIHTPPRDADLEALRARAEPAHERLILEELYLLELGLALRRAARARERGLPIASGPRSTAAERGLPFRLTRAQQRAWAEIRADLARPHPMNRLLEGDVGSGKTAVAYLAAVAVAGAGHQTALMAPTELLAEQHARTLARLADAEPEGARLRLALLTASVPRAEAEAVRRALAAGEVDLVVGTHALVQEGVAFRSLALVTTDEQHRFGVRQRAALAGKAGEDWLPHALVMTATPIPRTLALTLYGDLDLSVLDELPPGREPVQTLLLRAGEGRRVADLLQETAARGEQAYVVYPLVEESEGSDLRAAQESAERIRRAFPELSVDLVHGRLDARARADAMQRFERGETQVLVATTVIEVGVDVPRATLMVVEHAERFGLAQLHQLRGRVGRGGRPGTCVLVARASADESEARLAALLGTRDGFAIAEADLRLRGPGEFLGTRQHGRLPDLRLADLARDARLVSLAREAALEAVRQDPGLRRAPALARAVRAHWGERLAWADVG